MILFFAKIFFFCECFHSPSCIFRQSKKLQFKSIITLDCGKNEQPTNQFELSSKYKLLLLHTLTGTSDADDGQVNAISVPKLIWFGHFSGKTLTSNKTNCCYGIALSLQKFTRCQSFDIVGRDRILKLTYWDNNTSDNTKQEKD